MPPSSGRTEGGAACGTRSCNRSLTTCSGSRARCRLVRKTVMRICLCLRAQSRLAYSGSHLSSQPPRYTAKRAANRRIRVAFELKLNTRCRRLHSYCRAGKSRRFAAPAVAVCDISAQSVTVGESPDTDGPRSTSIGGSVRPTKTAYCGTHRARRREGSPVCSGEPLTARRAHFTNNISR